MDENVTAVIPAFNEENQILDTVNALKLVNGISKIIVVDDGSTDRTFDIVKNINDIQVIRNEKNKGKGYAIKTALQYVTSRFVLLVDADLGSSALEMKNLVENKKISSRVMLVALYPKPSRKGGFGLVKKLSQIGLQILTSQASESSLSGQRLIYTDFLRNIDLPDNFGFEFKMTLEALKNKIDIKEVPLKIQHRETGRNLKGFLHRGKQFSDIFKVVIKELIK